MTRKRRQKRDEEVRAACFLIALVATLIITFPVITLSILGVVLFTIVVAVKQADKKRSAAARRKRQQEAWSNHWVPLIKAQAATVNAYSKLDLETAKIQRSVLDALNNYGKVCAELTKAETHRI
jgi:type III secretory pathway component EscV